MIAKTILSAGRGKVSFVYIILYKVSRKEKFENVCVIMKTVIKANYLLFLKKMVKIC